ncbi:MAG: hypothetical protein QOF41_3059 [Methylobacteriaceae bacterium]|nr:hypothetical protein [Methylobacteriaceae bacterium]
MEVSCSATAIASLKQIAARSDEAYVEISTAIHSIRHSGLAGENHIAVLNHSIDVYLLEPASPGIPVLLVVDPNKPGECVMADIGAFAAGSAQQKTHAASAAGAAMGLIVHDIYAIP